MSYSLQIVENFRAVKEADRWYVKTANGHTVRGPFLTRLQAERAIANFIEHARKEEEDNAA